MKTNVFVISDRGNYRENNEDNFCVMSEYNAKSINHIEGKFSIKDKNQVIGVFDGMGGYSLGELASNIAASYCTQEILKDKKEEGSMSLIKAFDEINRKICKKSDELNVRLGTTGTVIRVQNEKIFLGHIGDSKCFQLSGDSIVQCSIDHIDNRSKYLKNKGGALTQFLGVYQDEVIIEPQFAEFDANVGDVYLLCTDGVTDVIEKDELLTHFNKCNRDIELFSKNLYEFCIERSTKDNLTLVIFEILRTH